MNAGNQLSTGQITVVAAYPPNGKNNQKGYKYMGTMASDQLHRFLNQWSKRKRNHPWGIVFNVDPIQDPGSHWLAMYYDLSHIEVFDSYGGRNFFQRYPGLSFLTQYNKVKIKNSPRLESEDTYVCGHYCLSFLWHRTRNVVFKHFLQSFPGPTKTNDKIVCQFVCEEMIPPQLQSKFNMEYIGPLGHPCQGCCCEQEAD